VLQTALLTPAQLILSHKGWFTLLSDPQIETVQLLTRGSASAAGRGAKKAVCCCLRNPSVLIASWKSVPLAAVVLGTVI